MEIKRNYIVCYDISSTKGRNKTVKILEAYGCRIQYSVFLCKINRKNHKKMIAELEQLTQSLEEDGISNKIYVYPLCFSCYYDRIIFGEKEDTITFEDQVIVI